MIGATFGFTLGIAGAVTVFLVFSPVFGYLGYSDRPGPGWFGSFPAIGWADFVSNAAESVSIGAFLAVLLLPALLLTLCIRLAELGVRHRRLIQVVSGLLGGVLAGDWMQSAGWYIAAGDALFWVALASGVGAGVRFLPRRHRPDGPAA